MSYDRTYKQTNRQTEIITLHVYIFIIKQDIRLYVPYSRPNGWTDWAEIFWGRSWVAGGCYRQKKIVFSNIFFFDNFFFHGQRLAL